MLVRWFDKGLEKNYYFTGQEQLLRATKQNGLSDDALIDEPQGVFYRAHVTADTLEVELNKENVDVSVADKMGTTILHRLLSSAYVEAFQAVPSGSGIYFSSEEPAVTFQTKPQRKVFAEGKAYDVKKKAAKEFLAQEQKKAEIFKTLLTPSDRATVYAIEEHKKMLEMFFKDANPAQINTALKTPNKSSADEKAEGMTPVFSAYADLPERLGYDYVIKNLENHILTQSDEEIWGIYTARNTKDQLTLAHLMAKDYDTWLNDVFGVDEVRYSFTLLDASGNTPFHILGDRVWDENGKKKKLLEKAGRILSEEKNPEFFRQAFACNNAGDNPLHLSVKAKTNDDETTVFFMDMLLPSGILIDKLTERNSRGETPVGVVIQSGRVDLVKTIFANAAENQEKFLRALPAAELLELAAQSDSREMQQVIIGFMGRNKAAAALPETLFAHQAASQRYFRLFDHLMSDPSVARNLYAAKDDKGVTMAHLVAQYGESFYPHFFVSEIIQASLVNLDNEGNSPLHGLAMSEHKAQKLATIAPLLRPKTVNATIQKTGDFEKKEENPFVKAAFNTNKAGENPFHSICRQPPSDDNLRLLDIYLNAFTSDEFLLRKLKQQSNSDKLTPFLAAVKTGNLDAVEKIALRVKHENLSTIASLSDVDGKTSLHYALMSGQKKLVTRITEILGPEAIFQIRLDDPQLYDQAKFTADFTPADYQKLVNFNNPLAAIDAEGNTHWHKVPTPVEDVYAVTSSVAVVKESPKASAISEPIAPLTERWKSFQANGINKSGDSFTQTTEANALKEREAKEADRFKKLVPAGEVFRANSKGETVLHLARGETFRIYINLNRHHALASLKQKDSQGRTPLLAAVQAGDVKAVETLSDFRPELSLENDEEQLSQLIRSAFLYGTDFMADRVVQMVNAVNPGYLSQLDKYKLWRELNAQGTPAVNVGTFNKLVIVDRRAFINANGNTQLYRSCMGDGTPISPEDAKEQDESHLSSQLAQNLQGKNALHAAFEGQLLDEAALSSFFQKLPAPLLLPKMHEADDNGVTPVSYLIASVAEGKNIATFEQVLTRVAEVKEESVQRAFLASVLNSFVHHQAALMARDPLLYLQVVQIIAANHPSYADSNKTAKQMLSEFVVEECDGKSVLDYALERYKKSNDLAELKALLQALSCEDQQTNAQALLKVRQLARDFNSARSRNTTVLQALEFIQLVGETEAALDPSKDAKQYIAERLLDDKPDLLWAKDLFVHGVSECELSTLLENLPCHDKATNDKAWKKVENLASDSLELLNRWLMLTQQNPDVQSEALSQTAFTVDRCIELFKLIAKTEIALGSAFSADELLQQKLTAGLMLDKSKTTLLHFVVKQAVDEAVKVSQSKPKMEVSSSSSVAEKKVSADEKQEAPRPALQQLEALFGLFKNRDSGTVVFRVLNTPNDIFGTRTLPRTILQAVNDTADDDLKSLVGSFAQDFLQKTNKYRLNNNSEFIEEHCCENGNRNRPNILIAHFKRYNGKFRIDKGARSRISDFAQVVLTLERGGKLNEEDDKQFKKAGKENRHANWRKEVRAQGIYPREIIEFKEHVKAARKAGNILSHDMKEFANTLIGNEVATNRKTKSPLQNLNLVGSSSASLRVSTGSESFTPALHSPGANR